jgi:hypothetical protein
VLVVCSIREGTTTAAVALSLTKSLAGANAPNQVASELIGMTI